jgi:predicted esterase
MDDVRWNETTPLDSGGALRVSGPDDADDVVLLVGGGTGASAPGRWSSSMTWLAPRVRRAVGPHVRLAQVRYADSSWNHLDRGIADVASALQVEQTRAVPPARIVLVALSMGGATCLANASAEAVVGLIAVAPWFPEQIPIDGLAGRRLLVLHGSLDNALPLVPGTSRRASRATVRRAVVEGIDAEWRDVPFGLHGLAVRWGGRIRPMPRARAYARDIAIELQHLLGRRDR